MAALTTNLTATNTGPERNCRFVVTADWFLAQSRPMTTEPDTLLTRIGFLRMALLSLALLNILLPIVQILANVAPPNNGHNLWTVLTTVITPVMAPLLIVILFFDYIMSRVRAADAEGAERRIFRTIGRIELLVIGINLLFWVPYFYWLL
jgi:hypothetical protein